MRRLSIEDSSSKCQNHFEGHYNVIMEDRAPIVTRWITQPKTIEQNPPHYVMGKSTFPFGLYTSWRPGNRPDSKELIPYRTPESNFNVWYTKTCDFLNEPKFSVSNTLVTPSVNESFRAIYNFTDDSFTELWAILLSDWNLIGIVICILDSGVYLFYYYLLVALMTLCN